jgi:hypothetical protein
MKRSFLIMATCVFGFANIGFASSEDKIEQEVVMVTPMSNPALSGFTGGFAGSIVASLFLVSALKNDKIISFILPSTAELFPLLLFLGVVGGLAGAANNFIWSKVSSTPKLVNQVKEEEV